ncbi:hypothetical protein [Planctomyces sp. SH-PL14]|uniref:hypothetical protein n=1 Tax=Planctomyces sp. SH-PL14 TaxID=1632864 RepID=UPI00078EB680|nr:hypothetical protein [Planctomyces sp. SH-PL14]AMV18602.1 hypothetical protein VT03_11965 [Planctomyces sp. SH-PL14]
MPTVPVDELAARYTAFRERGRTLCELVRQSLPGLLDEGAPIPPATVQGLAQYKRKYVAFCEFTWPNRSAPVGAPTFEHFEARLSELQGASRPAGGLSQLQARPDNISQLQAIHARIASATEEERETVQRTVEGLLRLASEGDRLTDQEWQALSEQVAGVFGRDVPLALARGRLFLAPSAGTASIEAPSAPSPPSPASVASTVQAPPASSAEEPQS